MRVYNQELERLRRGLCAIGVHAQSVERPTREKRYYGFRRSKSLGHIDIAQSPICWVNVLIDEDIDKELWETVYGVPDSRDLPKLEIRAVRTKSFPLLGKVLDVRWEPVDDSGISQALTNDLVLGDLIKKMGRFFTDPIITSRCSSFRRFFTDPSWNTSYWLIIGGLTTDIETVRIPSQEEWSLYETIAKRLLATPLTYPKP
jgi:hypothetical protein